MKENEWKELDLSCPPDLTKVYDFQKLCTVGGGPELVNLDLENTEALCKVEKGVRIVYRERQPEPPSHEEIMTKWWEVVPDLWQKVSAYNRNPDVYSKSVYCFAYPWIEERLDVDNGDLPSNVFVDWFINRKSATIPPEAE